MSTKSNSNRTRRPEYFTPRGIAKFAFLNDPQTKLDPDGIYSVALRLPTEDADTQVLIDIYNQESAAALIETHKTIDKIDKPVKVNGKIMKPDEAKKALKDTLAIALPFETEVDEEGTPTGNTIFKFKMKAKTTDEDGNEKERRPAVCDANRQAVNLDEVMIGSGTEMRVKFRIGTNYMQSANTLYLTGYMAAVQIIKLVQFSGDAFGGFGEEEGYSSSASEAGDVPAQGNGEGGEKGDF